MKTPEILKEFRVAARSDNANSFGLHGHVLVARDGEAWEVGRAIGPWLDPWPPGTDVKVPAEVHDDHHYLLWGRVSCEIPRKMPKPPQGVLDELFATKKET